MLLGDFRWSWKIVKNDDFLRKMKVPRINLGASMYHPWVIRDTLECFWAYLDVPWFISWIIKHRYFQRRDYMKAMRIYVWFSRWTAKNLQQHADLEESASHPSPLPGGVHRVMKNWWFQNRLRIREHPGTTRDALECSWIHLGDFQKSCRNHDSRHVRHPSPPRHPMMNWRRVLRTPPSSKEGLPKSWKIMKTWWSPNRSRNTQGTSRNLQRCAGVSLDVSG